MARASPTIAVSVLSLLAIHLALAAGQDPPADCSGHGTKKEDGSCDCGTPLPSAGASGWVGEDCELEVLSLPTNGAGLDVSIEGGKTVCWAASLWGSKQQPNYFVASATLAAGSQGSVSLYGLLAADPAHTSEPGPAPIIYPGSLPGTGHWDYLLQVGGGVSPHAVLTLTGGAAQAVATQAIYLCATNPEGSQAVSFTLRAAGHSCPLTLNDNGFVSICSSTPEDVRYSTDVCPTGVCSCVGAYSRPDTPVDTGLGFEKCSAAVDRIPDPPAPGQPTSVTVPNQQPSTWHFFNVTLGAADTHWGLVASATAASTSRMGLYVRPMAPPSASSGTYSARSDWFDSLGDLAVSLEVGAGTGDTAVTLTQGLWYVGVLVFGDQPVSYTLSERRSACGGLTADCSGRGTCDAATGTCTCNAGAEGPDCSLGTASITAGSPPTTTTPRTFTRDTYLVTGLGTALTLPTARVQVKVSYKTERALPAWVSARPQLLLSPAGADGSAPPPSPTPDTAQWRVPLPAADTDYTLVLDGGQLGGAGQAQVVVWNPLSSPYTVGYTLSIDLVGLCLDDCSGHGRCDVSGRCVCDAGWLGASCSVDQASITNTTDKCTAGSRLPVRKEEERATCWQPCDADTGKFDDTKCIDFTCDPTAADGRPQRRAGAQEACVVDLCNPAAGNVVITDSSGAFVCEHACTCPADGGLCAPEPTCLPDTVRCLNGLLPMTTPDGSSQCVAPPSPGVCEEGSLRLGIPLEGGSAYAVCVCSGAAPALASTQATTLSSSQKQQAQQLRAGKDKTVTASVAQAPLRDGPQNPTSTVASLRDSTLGLAMSPEAQADLASALNQNQGSAKAPLRDGTQCAWTSISADEVSQADGQVAPSKGVVFCVAGYQVQGESAQGLPLSDGRVLTSGGKCVKVEPGKRGTSGGMVFFWCVFSILLAGGLVVGGRHAMDWYEERRWDLGTGGFGGGEGFFGYVKLGMEKVFTRQGGGGGGGGGGASNNNHW